MIPTIGIMIGGYIIFRCIEIGCRNQSLYGSRGAQIFVIVTAAIGVFATGIMIMNLMLTSTNPKLPF